MPVPAWALAAGLLVERLDRALELDQQRIALAVQRLACGNLDPAFADAVFADIRAFLAVEANTDVVLEHGGNMVRAAGVDQRGAWAKRSGATMFAKDVGADAAAVAFEAYDMAISQKTDILMIDTAGRVQNKSNLMAELEKIIRVLKKRDEAVPHAVLLVLDATTGQNAFSQVETFKKMVDVTGLIVTKLDGSAKGGVLVGLADQFGLPVHAIGVGEGLRDLRAFEARQYARSLMGLEA